MRLGRTHRIAARCVTRQRSVPYRGFTLLEVIIALTLIILMMGGIVGFYHTTIKARESAVNSIREVLLMRALLDQIANEIRQATDIMPGDGKGFRGREDRLTIVRLRLPDPGVFNIEDPTGVDLPAAQSDLIRISYELLWDEELQDEEGVKVCHGLWRTQQQTFDPNPKFVIAEEDAAEMGGSDLMEQAQSAQPMPEGELFAPEIKYLKLQYFDGSEWRDRWDLEEESDAEASADTGAGDLGGEDTGGEDTGGEDTGGEDTGGGDLGGEDTGAGDLGGGDLSGGDLAGGGSAGGGQNGGQTRLSVLPQAIKITIGKVRVPPPEEELDITQLKQLEERLEDEEYHPDRYTIVVYLRQADQSRLSSRKHGVDNDLQMGEQTEGQP